MLLINLFLLVFVFQNRKKYSISRVNCYFAQVFSLKIEYLFVILSLIIKNLTLTICAVIIWWVVSSDRFSLT